MDKYLMQLIKSKTPEMNKDVVNGYSTKKLKEAPIYIDKIFRWAYSSMEEFCGIRYEGYEICDPYEEFYYTSKSRSNKRSVNVGESSIYMVKYMFSYKGEPLDPRYLYLPFCEDGNMIYIGGTQYFLFPVLSNKIISATSEGLFVKIMKDKKNFTREYYNIWMNEAVQHIGIIKSPLYDPTNRRKKIPDSTKAQATNVHYILSQYGFRKFWEKFYGWVPQVYTYKDLDIDPKDEYSRRKKIDYDNYYFIESQRIRPKSYMDNNYEPTDIVMVVPKDKMNSDVLNTIATIYYIIDNFPDKIKKENLDNPITWIITLGFINFSSMYKIPDLLGKMDEHFKSLKDTVDELLKNKLLDIGYDCEDIYDLLFFIKRDFAEWHSRGENISSMYDKELDVLEYTLSLIVTSIFKSVYEIKKKLSSKAELSKSEINDILLKKIKTGAVFNIPKNENVARSNFVIVAYSGDNKFFKITSSVIPQEGKKGGKNAKISINDPNNKLHASYSECGGYLAIVKPQPIGNGKLNPYVMIDEKGTIIRNPKFKELIDKTQSKIRSS